MGTFRQSTLATSKQVAYAVRLYERVGPDGYARTGLSARFGGSLSRSSLAQLPAADVSTIIERLREQSAVCASDDSREHAPSNEQVEHAGRLQTAAFQRLGQDYWSLGPHPNMLQLRAMTSGEVSDYLDRLDAASNPDRAMAADGTPAPTDAQVAYVGRLVSKAAVHGTLPHELRSAGSSTAVRAMARRDVSALIERLQGLVGEQPSG